jgi:small subunit ribosomal protein S1
MTEKKEIVAQQDVTEASQDVVANPSIGSVETLATPSMPTLTPVSDDSVDPSGATDTGRRIAVEYLGTGMVKTIRRQEKPVHSSQKPKASADENARAGGQRNPQASTGPRQAKQMGERRGSGPRRDARPSNQPVQSNRKQTGAEDNTEARERFIVPAAASPVPQTNGKGKHHEPVLDASVKHFEPLVKREWDESGDFASMLTDFDAAPTGELNVGKKVHAKLVHMSKDTAFFALGQKLEGSMSLAELMDANGVVNAKVGDVIDAFIVATMGGVVLSRRMSSAHASAEMLEQAKAAGMPVEGKVSGVVNGGFEVMIGSARAFCPISQIDLAFVESTEGYIGKTFQFLITEVSGNGRNVVVSRRQLLQRERDASEKARLATLAIGDTVEGKVTRLMPFGAFVDIGGFEVLIPVRELSHGHVQAVQDVVAIGDKITGAVLSIEDDKKNPQRKRVTVSVKAIQPEPFSVYQHRLERGSTLEGRVVRLEPYGAFVELFPGVDGLVHVSEISDKKVRHPEDVLKIGAPVTVRILEVDPESHRISLSLRENVSREDKGATGSTVAQAKRGDAVDGVVERIERYGVFVKLGNGQSALLPASETGLRREEAIEKHFHIGDHLQLLVIDIDERGRLRVSKTAKERAEERALVSEFVASKQGSGSGLGTLGDLFRARK